MRACRPSPGSLAKCHAFRKGPVCAPLLNEAFPKRFQLEARQGLLRVFLTRIFCSNTLRYRHSLTSTKCPAIAAAAAIAGETRWVRPLKPWRPSKLRFEVEAQRSSGFSLSGFIARHIEQPGSRHSKPALMKIF